MPEAASPNVCHLCGYTAAAPDETACPKDGRYLVPRAEHDKDPTDAFLGRSIAGRYPIIGVLGQGGMGSVYRAIQQPVGRQVALKVIKNTGDDRMEVRKRFEREAKAVAELRHPNTITLHDFGVDDDATTLFMVLELLHGHTLMDRMSKCPMPVADSARIVAAVLDALVEAHGRGLVHRDLKPENVMLIPTEWDTTSVKVLDFGIARTVVADNVTAERLTQTGMAFGTIRYMAPEQTYGKDVDARADLYALGIVLYEMLTGRHPFEAENPFEFIIAHRQREPAALGLGVPSQVAAVVMRALSKAPAGRYADARTMASALRDAAGLGQADESGEVPSMEDVRRPPPPPPPPGAAHGASTLLGGTSRELAAEIVAMRGTPSRSRYLVPGVAAALALAVVVTWWIATSVGKPGRVAVPAKAAVVAAEPVGVPDAPAEPTSAKDLVAAALDLKMRGDVAGAEEKLAAAQRVAPKYAETYYLKAVLRGVQGDAAGVVAALDEFLKLEGDEKALGTRVEEDADFDRVRSAAAYEAWMKEHGLTKEQPARVRTVRRRPTTSRPKATEPTTSRQPAPASAPPAKAAPKTRKKREPEKVDGLGLDLDI